MPRKRAVVEDHTELHDRIIKWYRDRLTGPAQLPTTKYTPIRIGPTWQTTKTGHWLLPDATIGWDVLAWSGTWLQHSIGKPWTFTDEQARWLLWWYSLEADGSWTFTDGVLQRLKGWGKDPMAACVCANELLGPARFAGWDGDIPIVTDVPEAWVQTAAVALEQTKNTTRLFPRLFTPEARAHYRIQIGKEVVHALDDERFLQAVTSSPTTLEGARATFVFKNETHHWTAANAGHDMAEVIQRNATKAADGAARSLAGTNAYEPGEDSVAERDRDAYDAIEARRTIDTRLMYDSLEAPPEAPLTPEEAPAVVDSVRGDSTWLHVDRIVLAILDPRVSPSTSRRFWYNQITATEDAWLAPQEYDASADSDFLVADQAIVTLGFDGSKSDDHTALIGCDVDNDHLFEIGVWTPDVHTGVIDRSAVDRAVREAFETYDVVGFYGDVEHWDAYLDIWAVELGRNLVVKASGRQPIAWDIRGRVQQFTHACARLHDAIVESALEAAAAAIDARQPQSRLTHCGSARTRQHFHNARRAPNRFGVSVRKEHRESARKIDAVPAATLARLARLDYLALPASRRRQKARSGVVW